MSCCKRRSLCKIFLFRDLITEILLGNQWLETSKFIGLWGLTSSLIVVLSHYSSEVYRAKGKPKLTILSQVLYILCFVPVILWAIKLGYDFLCEMRALVRLTSIFIDLSIIYFLCKISPLQLLDNIKSSVVASLAMVLLYYILPSNDDIIIQLLYAGLCCLIYIFVIMLNKEDRIILCNLKNNIKK